MHVAIGSVPSAADEVVLDKETAEARNKRRAMLARENLINQQRYRMMVGVLYSPSKL